MISKEAIWLENQCLEKNASLLLYEKWSTNLQVVNQWVTILIMIKSFIHKGLEKFFLMGSKAGIQARHENRIRLILAQLNQSKMVEDMNISFLHLHELKGDRKGTWSVTVQANWRITFQFDNGDA
jgi:proteic killer suppression protein